MHIHFLVNKVFEGWSPHDTRLGGTEEGIREWAKVFHRKGYEVTVWQNGFVGDDHGVIYKDRAEFKPVKDIVLNHKSLDITNKGVHEYYFTTETDASEKDLSQFQAVVFPSQWARDNIVVNNPAVEVVNYGYDPAKVKASWKIPKQCLYASSPDRGLDTLLEIWPKVVEAHPDAHLMVTYGARPRGIPNVTFMGEVDEETMNDLYATSEVWTHPCNGGEMFGITGVKAQVAGAIPVYFPVMALAETVKYGIKCKNEKEFKYNLIDLLGSSGKREIMRANLAKLDFPTWESTADDILSLVTRSAPIARVEGQ